MRLFKSIAGCGSVILLLPCLMAALASAQAQQPAAAESADPHYQQLEQQLQTVLSELGETRKQLQGSEEKIEELQRHLDAVEEKLANQPASGPGGASGQAATDLRAAVDHLQEQDEILASQVKQHEQTKLESSSKYPIKMSGLILFNSYVNDGAVDNVDLPVLALARTPDVAHGSFASSMRQTILGLDGRGPRIFGARSSADVHIDFFGGIYDGAWNPYAGHVRLRTAHLNLDWENTSLLAAIDGPVFSPLEPASYAAVGEPSMAWSGNLWVWAPQVTITHRFPSIGPGRPTIEAGIMDPQPPESESAGGSHLASASEASKQPGYQARFSYSAGEEGHAMTLGIGGYFSKQKYSGSPDPNAWAATADWSLPITSFLEISGQAYRGSAIGGLGGGAFKDVYYDSNQMLHPLDDAGGWAQIKGRLTPRLEFNGAMGIDNAFSSQLRNANFYTDADVYDYLARNRTISGNFIYRPRAYLLFSAEYRNIHSWQVQHVGNTANSMSMSAGYLF